MSTKVNLKNRKNKKIRHLFFLLLALILLTYSFAVERPMLTQMSLYRVYRVYNRHYQNFKFRDWEEIKGDFFAVRYKEADEEAAEIVLAQAEEVYGQLLEHYKVNNLPLPVIITVYPNSEELSSSFGWPAHERALGAYHAGSIRLLSPRAYQSVRSLEEMELIYREYGPFIHEFTHLLIDYKAHGNYPRWFTEGLAQYEEYRSSNLVWAVRGDSWYSLEQLEGDKFDQIEDQAGAYWQSLQMVKELIDTYGENKLEILLEKLASGMKFEQAFAEQFGQELAVWAEELSKRF